jgi:hypothetical protein
MQANATVLVASVKPSALLQPFAAFVVQAAQWPQHKLVCKRVRAAQQQ